MATTVDLLLRLDGGPGNGGIRKKTGARPEKEGGGSNIQSRPTPDTKILTQIFGGITKFVKGKLGLNFGVAGLLKQSQIFTSSIGAIFQILGALIDVMLAPFLPYLMPLIQKLASLIPLVSGWMERVVVPKLESLAKWFRAFYDNWQGFGHFIKTFLASVWSELTQWWNVTAWPFLRDKFDKIGEWLGEKKEELITWFTEKFPPIFNNQILNIISWLSGAMSGIMAQLDFPGASQLADMFSRMEAVAEKAIETNEMTADRVTQALKFPIDPGLTPSDPAFSYARHMLQRQDVSPNFQNQILNALTGVSPSKRDEIANSGFVKNWLLPLLSLSSGTALLNSQAMKDMIAANEEMSRDRVTQALKFPIDPGLKSTTTVNVEVNLASGDTLSRSQEIQRQKKEEFDKITLEIGNAGG